MNNNELKRGCHLLLEHLPKYDFADQLLKDVLKQLHMEDGIDWEGKGEESQTEDKRDLYRALKNGFEFKDRDDRFTREDIEELKLALKDLKSISDKCAMGSNIHTLVWKAIGHIQTALPKGK